MPHQRQNVSSGGRYEDIVGYSRAVRVGPHVFVSGCTSMTPEGMVGVGDAYAQAIQALRTIGAALKQGWAKLEDVVRTRIYLTDMSDSDAVGRAHAEFFRTIKPAATMVAVSALIHPGMRVEIEAEAYVAGT